MTSQWKPSIVRSFLTDSPSNPGKVCPNILQWQAGSILSSESILKKSDPWTFAHQNSFVLRLHCFIAPESPKMNRFRGQVLLGLYKVILGSCPVMCLCINPWQAFWSPRINQRGRHRQSEEGNSHMIVTGISRLYILTYLNWLLSVYLF